MAAMVKQAAMVNVLFEVLNYSTLFTVNGTVSAAYPGNDSANRQIIKHIAMIRFILSLPPFRGFADCYSSSISRIMPSS